MIASQSPRPVMTHKSRSAGDKTLMGIELYGALLVLGEDAL